MRRAENTLEAKIESWIQEAPRTISDLRELVLEWNGDFVPRIERCLQRLRRAERVVLIQRLWASPAVKSCEVCEGRGWVPRDNHGCSCDVCGGAGWVRK